MHGTVPYLGSFLSDLTYLHTANPDTLDVRMHECMQNSMFDTAGNYQKQAYHLVCIVLHAF